MIKKKTQLLFQVYSGLSLGLSVVSTALLARFLGPESYGEFAVLLNLGFIVAPLTALVPHLVFSSAYKDRAKAELPYSIIAGFMGSLSLVFFPIAVLVLWCLPIAEGASLGLKSLALLNLFGMVFVMISQCLYQLRDQYGRFLLTQVFSFAAKLVGMLLLGGALGGLSVSVALSLNLFITCVWIIGTALDLGAIGAFGRESLTLLNRAKQIAVPSLLITLWSTLIYSLDILLAQRNFGAVDLSVYAILSSISKVTIILPSAIVPVVLQYGYRDRLGPDIPGSALLKSIALTIVCGIVVSLIGHAAAPFLLPLLFRRDFEFQGWAVPLATLAMTILSLVSFYVHYEFGRGRRLPLFASIVTMIGIFGAFLLRPVPFDLAPYCLFVLAWPVTNVCAILVVNRFTRRTHPARR